MKNYFIRILYCGEDLGENYFFRSNKRSIKGILRDFYIWKEEDDELSGDEVYRYLMCSGDVVELLICLEDKRILINDGEEN